MGLALWSSQREVLSFTMGINDNLQGASCMWQLVTSSYGTLHNPSESQASSATWNSANSNEGMNLIKYTLTKPAIFDCVESGERMSLVITENSFTPNIGF